MTNNSAYENLCTRRSIRSYDPARGITEDEIRLLLTAGMNAPTARDCQPWHFVVIDDRQLLDEFSAFHPYAGMVKDAPLGIVVCVNNKEALSPEYGVVDCSCASLNILNAAHALNLASLWCGIFPRAERMEWLSAKLNLPQHIIPLSFLVIGHSDQVPQQPHRYKEDKIHRNRW